MAKTYKPGFLYLKSANLKQEIAMNEKTGRVYCEDGAQYSLQEIRLFYEAGMEIDTGTHVVKRVFKGEVIKVEKNVGTDGQPKQIKGGTGNANNNNASPGEKVADTNGNGKTQGNGELDIY
jgi:hypothetical protein